MPNINENLNNFTTNTTIGPFTAETDKTVITSSGTWDNATLTVTLHTGSGDAPAAVPSAPDALVVDTLTADGAFVATIPKESQYWLVTSGGGGSLDINASHTPVEAFVSYKL